MAIVWVVTTIFPKIETINFSIFSAGAFEPQRLCGLSLNKEMELALLGTEVYWFIGIDSIMQLLDE